MRYNKSLEYIGNPHQMLQERAITIMVVYVFSSDFAGSSASTDLKMVISSVGNVGISTPSPNKKLEVFGDVEGIIIYVPDNSCIWHTIY